ncbi:nucleoside kinase [Spirochaeta isovalerica]|uniref:Uridine kinase n=1 Tax=Spirochaeta isovalerica TaxID=150 RepID=A0A841R7G5_9SPIO|nr:nucleoside kinase [Spirochaeta isovalerica]MBB6478919.1 uridine kinase [Spirochaeta isovalerica]
MQKVKVTIPGGKTISCENGMSLREITDKEKLNSTGFPFMAMRVNNKIYSLASTVNYNCVIEPVELDSTDGLRIYRKSLSFLLEMASKEVFPDLRLKISHSIGSSIYYFFDDIRDIKEEDLQSLSNKMTELVATAYPIDIIKVPYIEAVEMFGEFNQPETQLLLQGMNCSSVSMNICNGFMAPSFYPLVDNTSALPYFEIMKYRNGFLLRYPGSKSPREVVPFEDRPLLYSIYEEYKNWGKILNVNCVGQMNKLTTNKKEIQHFIRVSEALHNKKIAHIADEILHRKGDVKVVLIAGPSSSGKTTFTKKLAIELQVVGFNPIIVSLDDYYRPRHEVPIDEFGKVDLEALEALDVPLLNKNLIDLFDNKVVEIPVFDFKIGGRRDTGKKLQMGDRTILLMEGIHGLNERLTPDIPASRKYKIYLSALTQLNIDDHNRIATTDNRIIRRMVRDHHFRNYDALNTFRIWPSVRRGEEKNIFPYQESADSAFNSALDYEISVLKVYAEPLLQSVKPDNPEYSDAARLLDFLSSFTPIPSHMVPEDSILREFIGNSSFKY